MRNPIGFAKRYRISSSPLPRPSPSGSGPLPPHPEPKYSPITDGDILNDSEWSSYVDRMRKRLNSELNTLIDIQRKNGLSHPIEDVPTNKQLALDVAACAKEILVNYIYMSFHQEPGSQAQLITKDITKQIADFAFRLATKTILVDHPIWIHRLDPKRPRNHDGAYNKWEAEVLTHTDWKPCHQVMRRLQLLPAQEE